MPGLEGTTLANRYQDLELLGEGAMAHVYRAYDRQRRCAVALKLLRADYAEDYEFEQRFRMEAQTLEKLAHPNVVRYYGLERDGRSLFMVMEYVAGETLRAEMFSQKGVLSGRRILEILYPLAVALDFAHARGVLHRDIKPANVLLAADGRVLLSDFGVARLMDASTVTTFVGGTPAYMSPEQCASKELTAKSDIYSFAVMAFEMLCGRRPFVGKTPGLPRLSLPELVRMEHLSAQPPMVLSLRPVLPAGLDAVFARSFAKQPATRPATTTEMVESLEALIKDVPGTVSVPHVNPAPVLSTISPSAAAMGFVGQLEVVGSGFVAKSSVYWDSELLITRFVSANRLSAGVPAQRSSKPGPASVTVVNPAPGGGRSVSRLFHVKDTVKEKPLKDTVKEKPLKDTVKAKPLEDPVKAKPLKDTGKEKSPVSVLLFAVGLVVLVVAIWVRFNLAPDSNNFPVQADVRSVAVAEVMVSTKLPLATLLLPTAVPATLVGPTQPPPTVTTAAVATAVVDAPAVEASQFPAALPTSVAVTAVGPAVVTCKKAGEWTVCGGKPELGVCAANEVGYCTDQLVYICKMDTKCVGGATAQPGAAAASVAVPPQNSGAAARTCSNKGEWTECGGKADLGICAPKEVGHCTDQGVYECVVENNKCNVSSNVAGGSASGPPLPTGSTCFPGGGIVNISGVKAWWVEHQRWGRVQRVAGNGNTGAWFYKYSRAIYTALDGTEGIEWCRGDQWK